MSSYADILRKTAEESKSTVETEIDSSSKTVKPSSIVVDETVQKDSSLLFNQIKSSAKDRMERRAKAGSPSANIFEFKYRELCAVSDSEVKTHLYYVNEKRDGYNYYKIYDLVNTDYFKGLLNDYSKELGEGIQISIWHPKGDLNVIEVIWDVEAYNSHREMQAELRESETKNGSVFKEVKTYKSRQSNHPRDNSRSDDYYSRRDREPHSHRGGRDTHSHRGARTVQTPRGGGGYKRVQQPRYVGNDRRRSNDSPDHQDSRDYRDY